MEEKKSEVKEEVKEKEEISDPTKEVKVEKKEGDLEDPFDKGEAEKKSDSLNPQDLSRAVQEGFSSVLKDFGNSKEDPEDEDDEDEDEGEERKMTLKEFNREMTRREKAYKEETLREREKEILEARLEEAGVNEENKYLGRVNDSLKKAGIDMTDRYGKAVKKFSDAKFSELITAAQAHVGRNFLKPSEVKKVSQLHWKIVKPELEEVRSEASAKKNLDTSLSAISQGSAEAIGKVTPTSKMVGDYERRKKEGGMALEDVLAFNLGLPS